MKSENPKPQPGGEERLMKKLFPKGKYGLGLCSSGGCRTSAIVGVNGRGLCQKHMEEGFAAIGQLRKMLEEKLK